MSNYSAKDNIYISLLLKKVNRIMERKLFKQSNYFLKLNKIIL